jgi:hypothetical protein
MTGNIHFKVEQVINKGEYCVEYFSGEEFIALDETSININIAIYYDAVACD